MLEMKTNDAIATILESLQTSIPQAPPTTQVEDVEATTIIVHEPNKTIRFKLDKEIETKKRTNWPRRKAKRDHTELRNKANELMRAEWKANKVIEKRNRKRTLQNHEVPTIVVDSGATSTCIRTEDAAFVQVLAEKSPKHFLNANGTISEATNKAQLEYKMRQPAVDADIVPGLAMNSLLSTSKLADAGYVTVFTNDEVKIFDAAATPFQLQGSIIMKGWRCPRTKLWRVPLQEKWTNINTETALLNQEVTNIIMNKRGEFEPTEFVNSVYELPNMEQIIAWYHAAAGYPTKPTWIKAIDAGFYATWPMLTSKAVRKHFPESEETAKGHMRRVKSSVRSTKAQVEEPLEIQLAEAELAELRKKHRDIYVTIKEHTEMIHTDQTGRFPVVSE